MLQYKDGKLNNVWLVNGFEKHTTLFGEGISYHNIEKLTEAICQALARKAGKLKGRELHYIRSAGMLLSEADFSLLIGVEESIIAYWEKCTVVPVWMDTLARLTYLWHTDEKISLQQAMSFKKNTNLSENQIIVVELKEGVWEASWKEDTILSEPSQTTSV